jgi:hypothetical protein
MRDIKEGYEPYHDDYCHTCGNTGYQAHPTGFNKGTVYRICTECGNPKNKARP